MKTILITGAAGAIGSSLRNTMAGKYRLRLSDRIVIDDLGPDETFARADVEDFDAVKQAVDGVDGIVHMGGVSRENTWERILSANLIGTYNIYEAARQCGAGRVVFPSSNHATGFYRRDQRIPHDVTVRPDSRYGVSKAFGESMGSLYADKYGLRVLAIRIGNLAPKPVDRRRLSIWISPRDLAQLVCIGLEHPDLRFEIVYGVSDNVRSWYDNSNASRLGYRPEDQSEDYAEEILRDAPALDPDSLSDQVQGGDFAVTELGGGEPFMSKP
ncbi:MAG: NAD-dependent epimerase/dehydratase family protein [Gammaproteobacteria bacterium]